MKKILLIKLSSMGDLIQTFPAITDATRAIPGIQFDWVCEESFQDIPSLHPGVVRTIVTPTRRWKKNILKVLGPNEFWRVLNELRAHQYDMIIDAQSNKRSAITSLLARGKRYGLDATSVRENGAQFFYNHTISIDRNQNHTMRMRQLMAKFLGYSLTSTPADYGIQKENLPKVDFILPHKFVFITAICSTVHKLWPERHWKEVIDAILAANHEVVMPWWSVEEKERILRLKNNDPRVHLLPAMNLQEKAYVLSHAKASISLDTGLAHMAAALNVPNICLYGPVDFKFSGTVGVEQKHLRSTEPSCVPCDRSRCRHPNKGDYSPCMVNLTANEVTRHILELITG